MWQSVAVAQLLYVLLSCLLRWPASILTNKGESIGIGGTPCTIGHAVGSGYWAVSTARVG